MRRLRAGRASGSPAPCATARPTSRSSARTRSGSTRPAVKTLPLDGLAHARAGRRAGHHRRVRRLRVPALPRRPSRMVDAVLAAHPDKVRLVYKSVHAADPRARRARGARRVGGGPAGQVLGDGAPALRAPGAPRGTRDLERYAHMLKLDMAKWKADMDVAGGEGPRIARRPQARRGPEAQGHADDLRQRARARRRSRTSRSRSASPRSSASPAARPVGVAVRRRDPERAAPPAPSRRAASRRTEAGR